MSDLDAALQTRYALLHVLTAGTELTVDEIRILLQQMSYTRSRATVSSALRRLCNNGAVVWHKRTRKRHGGICKAWQLTPIGAQMPKNPPAPAPRKTKPRKGSKGSPAKTTNMCIDPTKFTLNSAIEETVADFVTATKRFSAHQVTDALRQQVSLGTSQIDPNEVGSVFLSGKSVAKIDHGYVRDVVHELFHLGKMAGYSRSHTGSFWQYEPAQAAVALPDAQTSADQSPAPPYDGNPTL